MSTPGTSSTIRHQHYGISTAEYEQRLGRVRQKLAERGLDAMVLFYPPRIEYLTGFVHISTERPIALVVPVEGEAGMLIPLLEQEHVQKTAVVGRAGIYPEYPTGGSGRHPMEHLADFLKEMGLGGKRLAADRDDYTDLMGYVGPALSRVMDAPVVEAPEVVDKLRQVKSPKEVELLREACVWANLAHALLRDNMAAGRSEAETNLVTTTEVVRVMLKTLGTAYTGHGRGFRRLPASAQMVAGSGTAHPHGMKPDQGLRAGDVIVTFTTANVGGYRSELERTMIAGEPSPQFRRHFDAMVAAQEAAFAAFRPGRTCAEVDAEVARFIEGMGLKEFMRHHTGHGVGLEEHEQPFCDLGDETVIEPGMVFSAEPGLYVPGLAGFRHSDTLIITEEGCELITFYPRDLDSLVVVG